MTIYAIGDIHGHLGLLHAAHARIEADRARVGADTAPVVHIGDLVDRGPNSAGVVEYLMHQTAQDPRVVVLLGNHDRMFAHWLTHGEVPDPEARTKLAYLNPRIGGLRTLASYGVDPALPHKTALIQAQHNVPQSHRAFLENCPRQFAAGECLFVHAGIRPGVPLDAQDPTDLIWIRDEFLYSTDNHGPLIVHGHTPSDTVEHMGNRLCIDTRAAYGGPLSAVAIEGRDAYLLTQGGRVPVPRLL